MVACYLRISFITSQLGADRSTGSASDIDYPFEGKDGNSRVVGRFVIANGPIPKSQFDRGTERAEEIAIDSSESNSKSFDPLMEKKVGTAGGFWAATRNRGLERQLLIRRQVPGGGSSLQIVEGCPPCRSLLGGCGQ